MMKVRNIAVNIALAAALMLGSTSLAQADWEEDGGDFATLRESADQGDVSAQFHAGQLCSALCGEVSGVGSNWRYHQSAEQGYGKAQQALGF